MDIIESFGFPRLFSRNFQDIHDVPMEAHMTINNTIMLYGDNMFLSTMLLELPGTVNGHY